MDVAIIYLLFRVFLILAIAIGIALLIWALSFMQTSFKGFEKEEQKIYNITK